MCFGPVRWIMDYSLKVFPVLPSPAVPQPLIK